MQPMAASANGIRQTHKVSICAIAPSVWYLVSFLGSCPGVRSSAIGIRVDTLGTFDRFSTIVTNRGPCAVKSIVRSAKPDMSHSRLGSSATASRDCADVAREPECLQWVNKADARLARTEPLQHRLDRPEQDQQVEPGREIFDVEEVVLKLLMDRVDFGDMALVDLRPAVAARTEMRLPTTIAPAKAKRCLVARACRERGRQTLLVTR